MDFEVKTVKREVKDYSYFGWECSEDTRGKIVKANSGEHILLRDKNMKTHAKLVQLEKEYFKLKDKKKIFLKFDFFLCIVLFILLFLPGVFYIVIFVCINKKRKKFNIKIQKQMNSLVAEAKKLLNE